MDHFATTIALIGIVILCASLASGILERSGLPIVAVFLGVGAALGPYGLGLVTIDFQAPELHSLAMLALALVLFSDAVTVDATEVRNRKPLLWRLLGPGTIFPAAIIALSARFILDLSWPASAIIGAALASTDPVMLRSVLRFRGFPKDARIALRIETGMNDVVLLPVVVLAIIALGGHTTAAPIPGSDVARSIVGLFILGPALGALVGWLGIILLERIRTRWGVRRDYESLYAIGLALSAFAFAEGVGGSGFLAAFAAGFMVSSQDVELCDCFLEYGEATAEMLLLLTFVALGASLIWNGLEVMSLRTLIFVPIALVARTVVLYPVLTAAHVTGRDRKLIALFGPRGLSSLLLTLLPIFAGIPGAENLFAITSLVVLCSVVVHGTGIAIYLRRNHIEAPAADTAPSPEPQTVPKPLPIVEEPVTASDRITIDEVRALQASGENLILLDARAERNRRNSDTQAAGSIRIDPHDPVRDATQLRLSQRATLVVYCA